MTVERQPEAVLRLVHDVAEQIHGAIDDVGGELPFNVQISWDRERGDTSAITEPKRAILRDLLVDVRLFDSPKVWMRLRQTNAIDRGTGLWNARRSAGASPRQDGYWFGCSPAMYPSS